ncbi:MAG: hypothetical protein IKE62_04650 [Oscillospiraceae bacterium]|nr:hypothetical protein [Oscillospiraceae bacterium]
MKLIKAVATLAVAAVLLLAVFLIWRALSKDKFTVGSQTVVNEGSVVTQAPVDMGEAGQSDDGFTLTLTQAQLAVLIEKAVSQYTQVSDVGVTIAGGGGITVSFRVKTAELAQMLINDGKELPDILQKGAALLGEWIETDFAANISSADGRIVLKPTAFGILGLSLGAGLIPEAVTEAINEYVNDYVTENIGKVNSVSTEDGVMTLTGNFE